MLTAERTALHHELHVKRVDLQQQDLDRVTNFLESLGTQAALLAGFAFSVFGASLPTGDDAPHQAWKTAVYLSAMLTIGAHLYVVCVGQLTAILGPLLALKGPAGSLKRAIDSMKDERHRIFYFFGAGLAGFYLMTVALAWSLIREDWLAALCTALATVLMATIAARCKRIVARFAFVEPELPTIVLNREFDGGGDGGDIELGGAVARSPGAVLDAGDAAAVAGASLGDGEVVVSAADYLRLQIPNAGQFITSMDASDDDEAGAAAPQGQQAQAQAAASS